MSFLKSKFIAAFNKKNDKERNIKKNHCGFSTEEIRYCWTNLSNALYLSPGATFLKLLLFFYEFSFPLFIAFGPMGLPCKI